MQDLPPLFPPSLPPSPLPLSSPSFLSPTPSLTPSSLPPPPPSSSAQVHNWSHPMRSRRQPTHLSEGYHHPPARPLSRTRGLQQVWGHFQHVRWRGGCIASPTPCLHSNSEVVPVEAHGFYLSCLLTHLSCTHTPHSQLHTQAGWSCAGCEWVWRGGRRRWTEDMEGRLQSSRDHLS